MNNNTKTKEQAAKILKMNLVAGWDVMGQDDVYDHRLTVYNGPVHMYSIRFEVRPDYSGGNRVKDTRKGSRWARATEANILKAAKRILDRCIAQA